MHQADGVGDQRLEARGELIQIAIGDLVSREGQAVVHLGQDEVLLLEDDVELLAEDLGVQKVLYPQADAGRLVGIGGADAPLGGAEAVLAQVALREPVQLGVVRHDQVGVAAHPQATALHPPGLERVDLLQQHAGVDDHAVADDRGHPRVENSAGDELEGEVLVAHDDGVPGVVSALVADDHLHRPGEEVGELALSLVAPLGAHNYGPGHARLLRKRPPAVRPVYR